MQYTEPKEVWEAFDDDAEDPAPLFVTRHGGGQDGAVLHRVLVQLAWPREELGLSGGRPGEGTGIGRS